MKDTDMVEAVIVTPGGYFSWQYQRSEQAAVQRRIIDEMRAWKANGDEVINLNGNFLWRSSINGFYTREIVKTAGEKLAETNARAIALMEKAMEAEQSGDEWKDE